MAWGWIGSKLALRIYALKKKSSYCIRVHFSEKLGLVWINTYMCVCIHTYIHIKIDIYTHTHRNCCTEVLRILFCQ